MNPARYCHTCRGRGEHVHGCASGRVSTCGLCLEDSPYYTGAISPGGMWVHWGCAVKAADEVKARRELVDKTIEQLRTPHYELQHTHEPTWQSHAVKGCNYKGVPMVTETVDLLHNHIPAINWTEVVHARLFTEHLQGKHPEGTLYGSCRACMKREERNLVDDWRWNDRGYN